MHIIRQFYFIVHSVHLGAALFMHLCRISFINVIKRESGLAPLRFVLHRDAFLAFPGGG